MMKSILSLAAVLSLASVSANPPSDTVGALRLGEEFFHGPLTLWPVFREGSLATGPLISLQQAELASWVRLEEIGDSDEEAEVGTLKMTNQGLIPILVCAGTVVEGGKQNRQISQDFVIQPGATLPVGVFCVERGRWGMEEEAPATSTSGFAAYGAAPAPVRRGGQYEKDQEKVWGEVGEVGTNSGNESDTEDLVELLTQKEEEKLAWRKTLRSKLDAFFERKRKNHQSLVGLAYGLNGQPVSLRAFASTEVFFSQLGPFLDAIILEVENALNDENPVMTSRKEFLKAFRTTRLSREELHDVPGGNKVGMRECEKGYYSRLLVWYRGKRIPVSEDWLAK